MPTVFLRISHLYTLFNSLLRYFFPKNLITSLFSSSYKFSSKSLNVSREPSLEESTKQPSSTDPQQVHYMDSVELKRVFEMFDRDGDGRITKKELSESLENLGISVADEDLEEMVEKIDVNGDGCVDMEEFGVLYQTIIMDVERDNGDGDDGDEEMREAFNVFDQNGDGFITGEELREVLGCLGLKQGRSVEDCKKMIRMVDEDGDGMVNYKEFKEMMRGSTTGFAA